MNQEIRRVPVRRLQAGAIRPIEFDTLAIEEPLEIRLGFGPADARSQQTLTITMRTPGDDEDLAIGFLFAEGIITAMKDIESIGSCGPQIDTTGIQNIVHVDLCPNVPFDPAQFTRNFMTSSSCGICGKTSLDALAVRATPLDATTPIISPSVLIGLPERLRTRQDVFTLTGGLHAAALFSCVGEFLVVREDIGRHNSLDKLIGSRLRRGEGFDETILLLSGRAGYELLQKALQARVPIVASVGASSSLAVELAERFGITLVGFLRGDHANIYSGASRFLQSTHP